MADPTSILTFEDLIVEAAIKMGVAFYGDAGDEQPQVPQNTHDLWLCQKHVNTAIRDFIASAPPSGWRWLNQVQSVVLWPSVAVNAASLLVSGGYDPGTDTTLLTSSTAVFYASMELRTLTLTGVGAFVIDSYVSAQSVRVRGDASAAGASPGVTWAITTDGAYTLPRFFSGQAVGEITYAPGESRGPEINWTDEASLRRRRELTTTEYGYPYLAATRVLADSGRRQRWELVVYPTPASVQTVQLPYLLYFDKLENLTDVQPAPFTHDETIRLSVRAVCERESMGGSGADDAQYRNVGLPNSYGIDLRSAPKRIDSGRRGTSIQDFRQNTQRETVQFNS